MIKSWHEWWRLYHWKKINKHELKYKKHTVKLAYGKLVKH